MTWHDDIATIIRVTDPLERSMEIGHFASCSLCFLKFRYTGQSEFRVGRHQAREFSHIFDHFARHEQLPTQHRVQPEYFI